MLRAKPTSYRQVVPPLEIIYEDGDMLVVNKPPGMTVQMAGGAVENAVAFYLNTTACQWSTPSWLWNSNESFEGIVHRLDKGTSGLLAIGKHPQAARALAASFRERHVTKTYLAIAVGMPRRVTAARREALCAANRRLSKSGNVPSATRASKPDQESATPEQRRLMLSIKRCDRDADRALMLLDAAVAAGEQPGAACYTAAISVCVRAGQRAKGLGVMAATHERGVTPNALGFQTALGLCAREPPLWREATALIGRMEACGLAPTAHCVSSAISACGRSGELATALALLDSGAPMGGGPTGDGLMGDGLVGDEPMGGGGPMGGGPLSNDDTCLRAAIRACKRCGDGDMARVLDDRLERSGGFERGEDQSGRVSLGEAVVISAPIGKLGKYTMGVMSVAGGGRYAKSVVTPLDFNGLHSLNRVRIETGRTHQIRVHMASELGCPLAGDRDYGSKHSSQRRAPVRRVMLHAAELCLPHPVTGASLRLACPPPLDFIALASDLAPPALAASWQLPPLLPTVHPPPPAPSPAPPPPPPPPPSITSVPPVALVSEDGRVQSAQHAHQDNPPDGAPPNVIIDLGFDDFMSERQIVSLAQQLSLCHAAAKRSRDASGQPALTYCLASYGGRLEARMQRLQGSSTWPAARHRQSWRHCLDGASPPQKLVYLSAEGDETLDTIDPDAVYVIGGLVDRNQHKGLSHRRAQEAGVPTARLPLAEHVALSVEGKGRALAVNHCYELLLLRAQNCSWEEAIRQVLPQRRVSRGSGVRGAEDADAPEE